MLNMMWATRIVGRPRPRPIATHRVRSEAPRMTSGAVIGMKMSRLRMPRPWN